MNCLKETDINIQRQPQDKVKHLNNEQLNLVNILDNLNIGDRCDLQIKETSVKLCISLNRWTLRGLIMEYPWVQHLLLNVTRDWYSTVRIICNFNETLINVVNVNGYIEINCSRSVCQNDLHVISPYHLSTDGYSVILINDSSETLLNDIKNNLHLLRYITRALPIDLSYHISNSSNDLIVPRNDVTSVRDIVTCELKLNKRKITYLIGKDGHRIETIRQLSNATIKIIPIPKRLNDRELNNPNSINQSVLVSGDPHSVAIALINIEAQLSNK